LKYLKGNNDKYTWGKGEHKMSITSKISRPPSLLRRLVSSGSTFSAAGIARFSRAASSIVGGAIWEIALDRAIKKLPPLKPGDIRLTHKTSEADLPKVVGNGLRYMGQVSTSALSFTTADAAAYYLLTCKLQESPEDFHLYPRERAVVFDLPVAEFERHDRFREWGEPNSFIIGAKYIIGVIDTSSQSRHIRSTQPPNKIMG
jgi:hypothetical protein